MTKNSDKFYGIAELIRLELDGKNVALGRYDTILWQVRSGYVVILYGALGLLFKDNLNLNDLSPQILLLVCGFSTLGYLMDIAFRIRQLRVVKAYNLLVKQALNQSYGVTIDADFLYELLQLAGESNISLERDVVLQTILKAFTFYGFTPLMIYFIQTA